MTRPRLLLLRSPPALTTKSSLASSPNKTADTLSTTLSTRLHLVRASVARLFSTLGLLILPQLDPRCFVLPQRTLSADHSTVSLLKFKVLTLAKFLMNLFSSVFLVVLDLTKDFTKDKIYSVYVLNFCFFPLRI